jgi:hypothetical protein
MMQCQETSGCHSVPKKKSQDGNASALNNGIKIATM